MVANIMGSDGLIVLIIAVVVLFGGSQLPKLAKNVGAAGHEFRKAQQEAEAEHAATQAAAVAPVASAPIASAPVAAVPVATPVLSAPAAAAPSDDLMLVSRSELKEQVAKMLEERDNTSAQ